MRVISRKALEAFWSRHPDAADALLDWYHTACTAVWRNITEVRSVYPHADAVSTAYGTLTVFNVCGIKYRLVVRIRYDWQLINVRCVLTHADYNREKWKE